MTGADGLWDHGGFYVVPRRLDFYLINNGGLMKTCFRKTILEADGGKTGGQTVVGGTGAAKKMVPQMQEDMNKVWIGNGNGEGSINSRGIYELESTELGTDWVKRVGE